MMPSNRILYRVHSHLTHQNPVVIRPLKPQRFDLVQADPKLNRKIHQQLRSKTPHTVRLANNTTCWCRFPAQSQPTPYPDHETQHAVGLLPSIWFGDRYWKAALSSQQAVDEDSVSCVVMVRMMGRFGRGLCGERDDILQILTLLGMVTLGGALFLTREFEPPLLCDSCKSALLLLLSRRLNSSTVLSNRPPDSSELGHARTHHCLNEVNSLPTSFAISR